ncbi:MAG TPA: hypothetical protein VGA34_00760, partial [Alteraurantiacibacter sp.]
MCADRHNRVGDRNGGEFSCITDCLGRTALLRRAAPLAALLGTSALAAPAAAQDNDGLYWAQRLHGGITVTATRT